MHGLHGLGQHGKIWCMVRLEGRVTIKAFVCLVVVSMPRELESR